MIAMNVDALWVNVNLATFDAPGDDYGAIDDAAIGVRDGRIAWLGSRNALPPDLQAQRTHDGGGRWLTPGLIDCHTHLVWAGSRAREFEQRLRGASYADIAAAGGGIRSTVRVTRAASEDELLGQSARRLCALMAEGVTTVEIKSGYGLDLPTETRLLQVARRLGRAHAVHVQTSFLGAHALPPECSDADAYIDRLCAQWLPQLHAQGLVDAVDAYCEHLAFTAQQTARVFDAAGRLGLPVKLHADQLSDSAGAALAAQYCALSADHLEFSNDAGIRAMAASGTVAVLLPVAFYVLRETRLPPLDSLCRHGVPVAIATDCNPGTAPCTSPLLAANMACTLFGMTPAAALAGLTRNAALALGLGTDRGRLAVGLRADFALWDIEHPVELVYALGGRPCVGRVVDGDVVDA